MAENVSAPASTPGASSSSTQTPPSAASGAGTSGTEAAAIKAVTGEKTPETAPKADGAQAAAEAEVKASRKRKIIVDGAEEEYDLDSLSDDDLVKHLQMSKAGQKRMQEAAEVRKQFAEFQKFVKADPFEALKDPIFGVDLEQLAQQRLAQKYQEATMPPEELEKLELKRKIEAYEKQETTRKQEAEAKAQQELDERVYRETESKFISALTSEGLPNLPETLSMMAEVARVNHQNGIGLTKEQLAAEVRVRLNTTSRNVIGSLKGEALLKHLGPETVKEILRLSVEKVRKTKAPAFVAPPGNTQELSSEEKPTRKITSAESFKQFLKK